MDRRARPRELPNVIATTGNRGFRKNVRALSRIFRIKLKLIEAFDGFGWLDPVSARSLGILAEGGMRSRFSGHHVF
jgi:hypothetical protein